MIFVSEDMDRGQLLDVIEAEPDLHHAFYYESGFLVEQLTTEEIYEFIVKWIEEGD